MVNKKALLLMVAAGVGLSSCHFGDSAEDMLNKYNNVERDIAYSLNVSKPGGTRVSLTDQDLNGVNARWELSDRIAMFDFGDVFCIDPETNLNSPLAVPLKYEKDANDLHAGGDAAYYQFGTRVRSKIGNGQWNAKKFVLFYPYGHVANMSCNATGTSVTLDFTQQTGKLMRTSETDNSRNIADNYLYAWGFCEGKCEDAVVTLTDKMVSHDANNVAADAPVCNQEWHEHAKFAGEQVLLDNKMAIVRLSFVRDASHSLGKYLEGLTYNDINNYKIKCITIENQEVNAPSFSAVNMNLKTGKVSPASGAYTKIVIENPYINEIAQEYGTPSSIGGQDHVSWGSTLYVALPVPENSLEKWFRPIITIETVSNDSNGQKEGPTYFALLAGHDIKEGDYYMTSAITVSPSSDDLQVQESIFLYYHSAYVWDKELY